MEIANKGQPIVKLVLGIYKQGLWVNCSGLLNEFEVGFGLNGSSWFQYRKCHA